MSSLDIVSNRKIHVVNPTREIGAFGRAKSETMRFKSRTVKLLKLGLVDDVVYLSYDVSSADHR